MKLINNRLFEKSAFYNLNSIIGGTNPTTIHKKTLNRVTDHWECDHSKDHTAIQ